MNTDDIPEEPELPEGDDAPKKSTGKKAAEKAAARVPTPKGDGKTQPPAVSAPPASDKTEISPAAVAPKPEPEAEAAPEETDAEVMVEEAEVKSGDGDGGGVPSTAVPVGTRINNNYEIEQLISAGGMGEVYRGVNYHTGDQVAIKIVLPGLAHDEKIITLFRREARILGKLYDEAIVRYLNFVKDEELGRFCLIMEYVDGIPLSDMMEESGAVSLEDTKLLIHRLAVGLDRAHKLEITHRDLSPDNIIVEGGKLNHSKLIDFGIAKSTNITEGTLHGQFAGKFNFVSPEQLGHFDGKIDGRSDIYSLGLLAAGAAVGTSLPMGASIVDAVTSRAGIPDLSAVYPELQPLLSYMLEPNPANRPATMAEVASMVDDPAKVPAQYRLDGGDDPAVEADPAMGRTVISPLSVPPQVPTGAPTTSSVPYSADSTGVSATGAGISLPPDASSMGQQTGIGVTGAPAGESPFGAAPITTPPFQDEAPAAAAEKSGGSGKIIGIAGAVVVAGGVGVAVMLGLGPFAPDTDPVDPVEVAVADPVETDPPVEPTPPPEPTSPEPVEPVEPPEPVVPEDPPEPVVPDDPPEPPVAPEVVEPIEPVEPPAPPPSGDALGDIGTQLAWLSDRIVDDCVYQAIRSTDGDAVRIEGFGTTAAPFEELLTDFQAAHGVEPDIGVRLVRESQCPVIDFVAKVDRSSATAPVLELDTDVLKGGDTLRGKLTGLLGRPVYLFLVSGKGGAFNLTSLLQPEPDGSQSFRFGMNASADDEAVPQMIVAVTTRSRLVTANAARNGADVAQLMPIIETEIQTSGSEAAVSMQYFRLDN